MSVEKIREGLMKLNPETDFHWTKEGLPNLSPLNSFSQVKSTRDEVEAAWPGFRRSNAAEMKAQGSPTSEQTPPAPPVPPVPPVPKEQTPPEPPATPQTAPLPSAETSDPIVPTEQSKAEREKLRELKQELEREIDLRRRDLAEVTARLDQLVEALPQKGFAEVNAQYNESQAKLREQRAERLKELQDMGVTKKMLDKVFPQPSPIDQALRQRPRNT